MASKDPEVGLTAPQRVYLAAFDRHLRAGKDEPALEEAKRRTNAALAALGKSPGSAVSRDWIDALLSDLTRSAGRQPDLQRGD